MRARLALPDSVRFDVVGPLGSGRAAAFVIGDSSIWADPEEDVKKLDEIWKESPVAITIGDYRGVRRQGEAICYRADGKALLATSEGRPCPLIEIARHN